MRNFQIRNSGGTILCTIKGTSISTNQLGKVLVYNGDIIIAILPVDFCVTEI